MTARNTPYTAMLYSLAAFSLYALGDAIFKYLSIRFSPFSILFFGMVSTSTVLLCFAPRLGGLQATLTGPHLKWHMARGVCVFLELAALLYGLSHMSLAKAYALIFSAPFISTILALIIFKEYVSAKKWVAIALGFGGVLVVLRPGLIPLDLPSLSVLGAAFFFSVTNLMAKRQDAKNDTLLAWGLIPMLTSLALVTPIYLTHLQVPAATDYAWILLLGMFNALGFLLMSLAFMKGRTALVAPFHYVQILWGLAFGYLFFNDTLDMMVGIGAAIIIGAGIWLIRLGNTEPNVSPVPFKSE